MISENDGLTKYSGPTGVQKRAYIEMWNDAGKKEICESAYTYDATANAFKNPMFFTPKFVIHRGNGINDPCCGNGDHFLFTQKTY